MPFDANADLHEELKQREQVEDQLAGMDKDNQETADALPAEEPAAQEPDVPLEDAFAQASTPPQVGINTVQNNDKFIVGEQIRIPVDLSGAPKDRLSIEYNAVCVEDSNYGDDGQGQIDLDDGGAGQDGWSFKSDIAGSYMVQVKITNGQGYSMTQEVLVQVVAPEGQPVAEALPGEVTDGGTAEAGGAGDQQMSFAG